ncbi:MAG: DNA primase [Clostridia bacterium]|nr:DNA primase [Clostridia bacterium]
MAKFLRRKNEGDKMARGLIPQEIIDEIATRLDIVEVINEYVRLEKSGRNFFGLCPFHNEKTPSFSVSPEKQIFHCFGCGTGGNVFTFVMQIEGLSFPEALEKLAQRVGVSLPKRELTEAQKELLEKKQKKYKLNLAVSKFFHRLLLETSWGKPALNYLKKRGIDIATIEKFQLGVSLPQWDGLLKYFTQKGVSPKELEELGLVVPNNSQTGYYDRFRNRLMFPIWDEQGNVIAFGGRVLDDSQPKYLNSPETSLFHKGKHLYGLHLAKNSMRSEDMAIIVEGYMDVIACHQFGVTNAVASLGTAFTKEQAKLLMRHTYQIAFAYDADLAGSKATLRGLDIFSDYGCQIRVIKLPEGLDPDEYLRKYGKNEFNKLVLNGMSLIEYKLVKLMESTKDNSILSKTKIVQKIIPDLLKMDSMVARESAVKLISEKLDLTETTILSELRYFAQQQQKLPQNQDIKYKKRENNPKQDFPRNKINRTEAQLIKILFEHPHYLIDVEKAGGKELFTYPLQQLFEEIFEVFQEKGEVVSTDLSTGDNSKLLAMVLMQEFRVPDLEKAVADYIKILKVNKLEKEYLDKQNELKEAEKLGDGERLKEILSHIEWILQEKRTLAP